MLVLLSSLLFLFQVLEVKMLIVKKAKIDQPDGTRRTPIDLAAGAMKLDVVRLLVEHRGQVSTGGAADDVFFRSSRRD